jgi:3-hydroxyacyl-[acyl-carrier-protein] dehydratase
MRWIFVDKILEMNPGKSAVGIRSFSRAELFFMDHFPGFPIVPGVLQVEMIAQVGGKCIMAANSEILPVLSSVKSATFRSIIEPGDQAIIKVDVTIRKSYSLAKGNIEVNGRKVAEAEVMYAHIQIPKDLIAAKLGDDALNEFK